jgi:hypothetical protein
MDVCDKRAKVGPSQGAPTNRQADLPEGAGWIPGSDQPGKKVDPIEHETAFS